MDPLRRDRPVRGGGAFRPAYGAAGPVQRAGRYCISGAAIADTLALGLVLLGVMVAVGFRAVLWKLVLVLVIQWCTSPLSSHMLAQFEYRAGQEDLARYLELPEETEEVSAP